MFIKNSILQHACCHILVFFSVTDKRMQSLQKRSIDLETLYDASAEALTIDKYSMKKFRPQLQILSGQSNHPGIWAYYSSIYFIILPNMESLFYIQHLRIRICSELIELAPTRQ